jgi:hypothetical protein
MHAPALMLIFHMVFQPRLKFYQKHSQKGAVNTEHKENLCQNEQAGGDGHIWKNEVLRRKKIKRLRNYKMP